MLWEGVLSVLYPADAPLISQLLHFVGMRWLVLTIRGACPTLWMAQSKLLEWKGPQMRKLSGNRPAIKWLAGKHLKHLGTAVCDRPPLWFNDYSAWQGDPSLNSHCTKEACWVTLGQSQTLSLTNLKGLLWRQNGREASNVSHFESPLERKMKYKWKKEIHTEGSNRLWS